MWYPAPRLYLLLPFGVNSTGSGDSTVPVRPVGGGERGSRHAYAPDSPTGEKPMCIYCTYREDGWAALLQYDDVYQEAASAETESTYGFHESWDELRDQLA